MGRRSLPRRACVPGIAPEPQAAARDLYARVLDALHSLVAARAGGEWRIALFQYTPAQHHGRPEAVEEHTAEIERVRAAGETVG